MFSIGAIKKGVFGAYTNSKDADQSIKLHYLIYMLVNIDNLHNLMIQYRNNDSPDQTGHLRSLIRAFFICIIPKGKRDVAHTNFTFRMHKAK